MQGLVGGKARSGSNPKESGRGGEIRTPDFLLPKQALYQAKLRPDGRRSRGTIFSRLSMVGNGELKKLFNATIWVVVKWRGVAFRWKQRRARWEAYVKLGVCSVNNLSLPQVVI